VRGCSLTHPLFFSHARSVYVGPDGEWVAASCKLLPPTPTALLAAFPNKRLLLMGDSHVRNYFTTLVSFARCVPPPPPAPALGPSLKATKV